VSRGEAHGAIVTADEGAAAGPGWKLRSLAGTDLVLAEHIDAAAAGASVVDAAS
jgi:hypothetical protein